MPRVLEMLITPLQYKYLSQLQKQRKTNTISSTHTTHTISLHFHTLISYHHHTMAAVLETLTIPRAASSLSVPTPRAAVSARRLQFSDFKGINLNLATASVTKLGRRGTRVVCEARGAAVEVAPVSDDSWQSLVLECDTPVLVEFWAPWCGPCRMIHPVIDELAKEYTGKLKCYKVNTDECPSTATRYGIRSIPTVMIFKDGEKKDAVIGAVPKSTLETCIEKFL